MQTLFIVNINSDFLYDEVIKFFPRILLAYCNTHNYNRYILMIDILTLISKRTRKHHLVIATRR